MQALDAHLFILIHGAFRSAFMDSVMAALSRKETWFIPIAMFLLYGFRGSKARGLIVLLSTVAVLIVADWSSNTLKGIIQRPRPGHLPFQSGQVIRATDFSFPSGHATNVFALAALWTICDRSVLIPMAAIAVMVGYSRIYLGAHFPFDVVGGAILGSIFGLAGGAAAALLGRRIGVEVRRGWIPVRDAVT